MSSDKYQPPEPMYIVVDPDPELLAENGSVER
jgi:hypothetical protein